jgi:hypothetical protein
MTLEQQDIHTPKNKVEPVPHLTCKGELKMD